MVLIAAQIVGPANGAPYTFSPFEPLFSVLYANNATYFPNDDVY